MSAHLVALCEVTVGRGPDKPALPMLQGQTVPVDDVAAGIVVDGDVGSSYEQIFALIDKDNPAPEPD